jgi:hypothetical protein
MAPRRRLLPLLLLLGCSHSEPFTNPDTGTDQPFDPGPPVRITANRGGDLEPAWLADGSGMVYSVADPGRRDRDICLGLLPAGGDRQSELWCDVPDGFERSDGVLAAGPGPDGRLAFLASSAGLTSAVPEDIGLRVAPTVDPTGGVETLRLPYPRGAGLVNWAGRLRWVQGERLAFLGQTLKVRQSCAGFVCSPPETTVTSLGVELLQLASHAASALPGTAQATGLATIADGAVVLYTLPGDSRVFRRNLASGAVSVAHDFGAAGIARDLDAAGTRLVAVVGGLVGQVADPDLGPIQWDSGGVLHLVDLADGSDTPLPEAGRLYRRPALSPAGDLVVAEGYGFSISPVLDPGTGEVVQDTTIVSSSDLYRFGGP